MHSGTPSAVTGRTVHEVKSIPNPTTSPAGTPALATTSGTASLITFTQSSGSCSAQSDGSRSPVPGSVRSITALG